MSDRHRTYPNTADLAALDEAITESALKIREAARRAGFSDRAAWAAADAVARGAPRALGGKIVAPFYPSTLDGFPGPETGVHEPRPDPFWPITDADRQRVADHHAAGIERARAARRARNAAKVSEVGDETSV